MSSYRTVCRLPVANSHRVILKPASQARNMAFFPRAFVEPTVSPFTPLFRFLDDFESYARQVTPQRQTPRFIQPRFDVREGETQYELHGEFPGISQDDLTIEFTDAQTLTIRARSAREYRSSPAVASTATPAVEEPREAEVEASVERGPSPHQATVEDEGAESIVATPINTPAETPASEKATPVESESEQKVLSARAGSAQQSTGSYHYERSVGDYFRQFNFPARVDQEAVTASLKNGILSVVVPKAKKYESRRIAIA